MVQLQTSPPPPEATELHVWVLSTSVELRDLRAALGEALDSHLHPRPPLDKVAESMILVATELATNAIKHGQPPTEIRLLRADDMFVLDVADYDLNSFPELSDTRPVNAGGRGLMLAREFSVDVGWYATEHTKHIWATFPATA